MGFAQEIIKQVALFMKQNGYIKKGNCFYHIQNDVAYCIEIDYTGYSLYVTYYFVPLYIPTSRRYYSYGDRLNSHPKSRLPSLHPESPQEVIQFWIEEFKREIEQLVIPFFDKVSSPTKIVQYFSADLAKDKCVHCPEIQIDRLLLFTHSYLNNKQEFRHQVVKMHQEIQLCSFLAPQILEKYTNELQRLIMLNQAGDTVIDEYYASVISLTRAACF